MQSDSKGTYFLLQQIHAPETISGRTKLWVCEHPSLMPAYPQPNKIMNIHEKATYEDLGNHGGIYDGGDDLQGPAALGTLLDVDVEHPFEQPGPAHAGWRRGRERVTVLS